MTGRVAIPIAVVVTTVATAGFALMQNTGAMPGGRISVPKALWLNLALLGFLVIPGLLWRSSLIRPRLRLCFGILFISFALRGAVELPILYLTDWWQCSYGAAHDVATAVLVMVCWWRHRGATAADGLLMLVLALCAVEASFASAFCAITDPAAGWFATDEARFRSVNLVTWAVVAVAYPLGVGLMYWVLRRPT